MSKQTSPWQKVAGQLQDPWDWAAAAIGAAGGAVATIFLHGADLGHSIPTGALGAVAGRKTLVASSHRRRLRKRALKLEEKLREHKFPDLEKLLKDAREKFQDRIMKEEDFENLIQAISNEDSKRWSGISIESLLRGTKSSGKPPRKLRPPDDDDDHDGDDGDGDSEENESADEGVSELKVLGPSDEDE
jgi:hypothetical protein